MTPRPAARIRPPRAARPRPAFPAPGGPAAAILHAATIAALTVGTALPAVAQRPAHVRVVSLVPHSAIDVRIRPLGEGRAFGAAELATGAVTDYGEARPGRYEVEVRAGGDVLERTTFGFGVDRWYTVAILGLPAPGGAPGPETLHARLRRIFGGADGISADGFYPQVRVLWDDRDAAPEKALARAVHAAPAVVPMTIVARRGDRRVTIGSNLRYPRKSALRDLEPGRWTVEITPAGSSLPLLELETVLREEILTTLFLTGEPRSGSLRLVPVENPVGPRLTERGRER